MTDGGKRGEDLDAIWTEFLCQVIEKIMDSRLNVIEFRDCLHDFVSGRGTGTVTLEAKLVQHLAYLR